MRWNKLGNDLTSCTKSVSVMPIVMIDIPPTMNTYFRLDAKYTVPQSRKMEWQYPSLRCTYLSQNRRLSLSLNLGVRGKKYQDG
jgi:hypothetical protein